MVNMKYGDIRGDGYVCTGQVDYKGDPCFRSPKAHAEALLRAGLHRTKTRAEEKNLPFDLDAEYVMSIWPEDGKCPALGITLVRGGKDGKRGATDYSPSLDRINPELGYVRGNVQWLSKLANAIKQNATPDQIVAVGEFCTRQATTMAPTRH